MIHYPGDVICIDLTQELDLATHCSNQNILSFDPRHLNFHSVARGNVSIRLGEVSKWKDSMRINDVAPSAYSFKFPEFD